MEAQDNTTLTALFLRAQRRIEPGQLIALTLTCASNLLRQHAGAQATLQAYLTIPHLFEQSNAHYNLQNFICCSCPCWHIFIAVYTSSLSALHMTT